MLQRVLGLLLSVIALFHLGTVAAAASLETETPFVFSVDRESYYGGERIELTVDTTTAQKDIAGFCVSIAYDDTRLSFLRVEPSSQIKNKTLQTDGTNNPVRSTYVCNVDLGHAPALSGTILTYVFEVNEGAPAGETELEVVVDQVCNWQGRRLKCSRQNRTEHFWRVWSHPRESCPHPFQPISIIIPWMSHIGCRALHLTRRQGRMERSVSAGKRCKKPDQRLRLPLPPLRRIKNRRRNTLWTSTGPKNRRNPNGKLIWPN